MDSLFGLDDHADIGGGFAVLTTVFSNEELLVVQGILKSADIPFLAKARGAGGAVGVIMGFNMYGTDIFVREEDLEAAEQLFCAEQEIGFDDPIELMESIESEEEI